MSMDFVIELDDPCFALKLDLENFGFGKLVGAAYYVMLKKKLDRIIENQFDSVFSVQTLNLDMSVSIHSLPSSYINRAREVRVAKVGRRNVYSINARHQSLRILM
jgi:hypothetical protein